MANQTRQIAEHIDELPDLIRAIADANPRPPIADVRAKLDYVTLEFECFPVGDFIEKHWTPDHAEKFMARVATVSNALQRFIATFGQLSGRPCKWIDRQTLAEFRAVARLAAATIRSWADEIEELEAATLLTDRTTKRDRISRQETAGPPADTPAEQGQAGGDGKQPVPNPSAPMSKKEAAAHWGGSMTPKKLSNLMRSGSVRHRKITRQQFIFCRDDIPNLPNK